MEGDALDEVHGAAGDDPHLLAEEGGQEAQGIDVEEHEEEKDEVPGHRDRILHPVAAVELVVEVPEPREARVGEGEDRDL